MLRTLTAVNKNGRYETKTFDEWARIKGVKVKYLRQRKRCGYSDNDVVNLPYGKSPKQMKKTIQTSGKIARFWNQFLYQKRPIGEI